MQPEKVRLLLQVATLVASPFVFALIMKWVIRQMDPQREKKDAARAKGQAVLQRLGAEAELTEYEQIMCSDVVDCSQIKASWSNVGGLDNVIATLKENIVIPFTRPDIFHRDSMLFRPPTGVLLYGPPGCGKTLLARALAKECGCCFINMKTASIMDKWFGESSKLVDALFSLARKLQPTLIFIDEIDSFLRTRSSFDNEASAIMKGEFLALWDGFASSQSDKIVIVGATNRPRDVDLAILRRMPVQCAVSLPNEAQREDILRVLLKQEHVTDDLDFAKVARSTHGFSGSDLRELCRKGAMASVREWMSSQQGQGEGTPRKVLTADLMDAIATVAPASRSSSAPRQQQATPQSPA